MGVVDMTLPRLGETMDEGRIATWLIAPGEAFKRGDVILEVETDKTLVEVPALQSGTLVEILHPDGDMVEVGAPIARIEVEGAKKKVAGQTSAEDRPEISASHAKEAIGANSPGLRASPAARRVARVSGMDLASIEGSGRNGRITSDDLKWKSPSPSSISPFAERHWSARGATFGKALYLHGLFADAESFSPLASRLSTAGYESKALDLPCHGRAPLGAFAFDDIVDRLSTLDQLWDQDTDLVGHSLGAALLAGAVAAASHMPRSLTLVTPLGLGRNIEQKFIDGMIRASNESAVLREVSKIDGPEVSKDRLVDLLSFLSANREGLRTLTDSIAEKGLQKIDIVPILKTLSCPVRIIFGSRDRILPWALDGTLMRLEPEWALHFIDSGHVPHIVESKTVSALIGKRW